MKSGRWLRPAVPQMNEPENQPSERFEPRAFEELFEQHRPLVRSVCQRYLRDPEDVEDAVQETFLKFLTQSRELHGSIRGWLASVAHTTSIDCIRRAGGERERRKNVREREPAGIEMFAVHEAIRRRLDAALLEIDPAARALIVARFFHKVELRLLDGQRNTSVPTMSRRVNDALRQLGQVLGDMG